MNAWALMAVAASTGALGVLHCGAMCGPLAVAGCGRLGMVSMGDTVGYFFGRLVSYATLGALMGALGGGVTQVINARWLQIITLGSVALFALGHGVKLLLQRDTLVQLSSPVLPKRGAKKSPTLLASLAPFLPARGLGLGLVTGLLPCGQLFAAFGLAASSTDPHTGAAVMAIFACTSSPGVLVPILGQPLLHWATGVLSPKIRGIAWCALAVWILVRPWLTSGHCCHT